MSDQQGQIYYERFQSGEQQIRAKFEVFDQSPTAQDCNFERLCPNVAETELRYTLQEVSLNGRLFQNPSNELLNEKLPEKVASQLAETRKKVLRLCSSCFVEHLMQSQEQEPESD